MTEAARTRIPARTVAAFSMSAVVAGALTTPLTVYLPNFYASHLGLKLSAVGAVFLAVKLLDIVFDPLAGGVMDRTRTRVGRYRFWLLAAAPVLMLGGWRVFFPDKSAGAAYLGAWLFVLYVGYSLLILSQSAWGAVLARDYDDRSRVYAWAHVVGVTGALAVLVLPSLITTVGGKDQAAGVAAMGWFIVLAAPATILIAALGTPERLTPKPRAPANWREVVGLFRRPSMLRLIACDFALSFGPGFTAPLYLFFFHQARGYTAGQSNVLLMIYIVAGVVGAPAWAAIAFRVGKHRALMAATGLYAVAQVAAVLRPKASVLLMAPAMFFAGFVANAFVFLVRAMVADVGDEVRLETGRDRTGLLYAFVASTMKIGSALAVGVTYTILSRIGFDPRPGAANTPEAIAGLEACYVGVPVVLVLAGGAALFGYQLDARRHAEIRAQLDARDAAEAAADAGRGLSPR